MVRNRTRVTVHGEGTPMLRLRLNLNPQRYCSVHELCEVLTAELQASLGRRVVIPPGTQLFYRSAKVQGGVSVAGASSAAGHHFNNDDVIGSSQPHHGGASNGLGVQLSTTTLNEASRTRRAKETIANAENNRPNFESRRPSRLALPGGGGGLNMASATNTSAVNTSTASGNGGGGGGYKSSAAELISTLAANAATNVSTMDRRDVDYFTDFVLVKDVGLIGDGDELLIDEWEDIVLRAYEQEREERRMRELQKSGGNNTSAGVGLGSSIDSQNKSLVGGGGGSSSTAMVPSAAGGGALVPANQQYNTTTNPYLASPHDIIVFDIFNTGTSGGGGNNNTALMMDGGAGASMNVGGHNSVVSAVSSRRMPQPHLLMVQKLIRELMAYHIRIVMFLSSQCSKEAVIAAQDIQVAQGQNQEVAEALVDEVTLGAKISDPSAAMRAATQLAVQRGKEEREFSDGIEAEKMRQLASVYRVRITRLEEELKAAEGSIDDLQQQLVTRELSNEQTIQRLRAEVKRLEKDSANALDRVWTLERANGLLQKQHREVSSLNERLFQEANATMSAAAMNNPITGSAPGKGGSGGGYDETDPATPLSIAERRRSSATTPLSTLGGGLNNNTSLSQRGKPFFPTSAGVGNNNLLGDSKGAATQVARRAEEERFHTSLANTNKHDNRHLTQASAYGNHPNVQSVTSPRLKAAGGVGFGGGVVGGSLGSNNDLLSGASQSMGGMGGTIGGGGQQQLLSMSSMVPNGVGGSLSFASPTSFNGTMLAMANAGDRASFANGGAAMNATNYLTGGGDAHNTTLTSHYNQTTANANSSPNRQHWGAKDAVHNDSQQSAFNDRSRPLHQRSLVPSLAPTAGSSVDGVGKRISGAANISTANTSANNNNNFSLPAVPKAVGVLQTGNLPSADSNAILQVHVATATGATHVVRFEIPRRRNADLMPSAAATTTLMSLLIATMPKVTMANNTNNSGTSSGASGGVGNSRSGTGTANRATTTLRAGGTPSQQKQQQQAFSMAAMQQQQQAQLQQQLSVFYTRDLATVILQGSRNALSSRLDPSISFIGFYCQIMHHLRSWQAAQNRAINKLSTMPEDGSISGDACDGEASMVSHYGGPSPSNVNGPNNTANGATGANNKVSAVLTVLPALPTGVENDVAVRPDPDDPASSFLVFFRLYYVRNGQRFPIATDKDLAQFLAPSRGPVYTCNCVEITDAYDEYAQAMLRRGEVVPPSNVPSLGAVGIVGGGGNNAIAGEGSIGLGLNNKSHANNANSLESLIAYNRSAIANATGGWSSALNTTGVAPNGNTTSANLLLLSANNPNDITAATPSSLTRIGRNGMLIDEYGIPIGKGDQKVGGGGKGGDGAGGGKDGTDGGASPSSMSPANKRKQFFPRRAYGGGGGGGNNTTGNGGMDGSPGGAQSGQGGKGGAGGDNANNANGNVDGTNDPNNANADTDGPDGSTNATDGQLSLHAPLFSGAVTNNLFLHSAVIEVPNEARLRRIYTNLYLMVEALPGELLDALQYERRQKHAKVHGMSFSYRASEDDFFAAGEDGDEASINLFAVGMRSDHILNRATNNTNGGALNGSGKEGGGGGNHRDGAVGSNGNNATNNPSAKNTTAGGGGGANDPINDEDEAEAEILRQLEEARRRRVTACHVLRYLCKQHDSMGDPIRFWRLIETVLHTHGVANGAVNGGNLMITDGTDGQGAANGGGADGSANGGNAGNNTKGGANGGGSNASGKNGAANDAGKKKDASSAGHKSTNGTASDPSKAAEASKVALALRANVANGGGAHGGRRGGGGPDALRPIKLHTSITFANFVLIVLKLVRE